VTLATCTANTTLSHQCGLSRSESSWSLPRCLGTQEHARVVAPRQHVTVRTKCQVFQRVLSSHVHYESSSRHYLSVKRSSCLRLRIFPVQHMKHFVEMRSLKSFRKSFKVSGETDIAILVSRSLLPFIKESIHDDQATSVTARPTSHPTIDQCSKPAATNF
jgi:hypothetical protein